MCITRPHPTETVSVHVQLVAIDDAQYARCEATCTFRFEEARTPLLETITRSTLPNGVISLEGRLRGREIGQFEIRIGNAHCILLGDDEDVVAARNWDTVSVSCTVAEMAEAGRYNVTLLVEPMGSIGFGYQANDEDSWAVTPS